MDNEVSELLEGALHSVLKGVGDKERRAQLEYALFPGGKRVRPKVFLTLIQVLGGELSDDAFRVASAIELIHTASLIHDDLPSIDNDSFRRRKPAFHVEFGVGDAVLVGDLLYALAFKTLSEISDEKAKNGAFSVISAANADVQLGQLLDIKNVRTPDEIKEVHLLKTASLFKASACSAYFFKASDSDVSVEILSEFGEAYGAYFQAINDLEDSEQTELFARASGSDAETGRGSVMQWSDEDRMHYVRELRERANAAASGIQASITSGTDSSLLEKLLF